MIPRIKTLTLVVEGAREVFHYPVTMELDPQAMSGFISIVTRLFLAEHGLPSNAQPEVIWGG